MRYRFEAFELDCAVFELRRGGRPVAATPKAIDVLLHLIRHRHRVVTKQELLREVWPGVQVGGNSLAQAIVTLRRALGDDDERSGFIRTVHSRGYQFIASVREVSDETLASPMPGVLAPALRSSRPFVGRSTALSWLRSRWRMASEGRTTVALVSGATGMGKTQLLEHWAAQAGGEGAAVLRARCHDTPGAPELDPWTQLVRDALQHESLGPRLRQSPALLQAVARAVVGLHDVVPEASPPPSPPGESAGAATQFRVFDDFARLLAQGVSSGSLVLMLDDVHWADPASVLLLRFLGRERVRGPLLIVASYTTDGLPAALGRGVAALCRDDPECLLQLQPLDDESLALLSTTVLGSPASPALLARLKEKTRGNPLLTTQVLQVLCGRADAEPAGQHFTSSVLAPQVIRQVIGSQLEPLSPACQEVLRIAAAIGYTFAADQVAVAAGRGVAEILDALHEAKQSGMVTNVDGRYEFQHRLVRDVLCRQLLPSERMRVDALMVENGERAPLMAAPKND